MLKYIKIENINASIDGADAEAFAEAKKLLKENIGNIGYTSAFIQKKSIDTRHKNNIRFNYSIGFDISHEKTFFEDIKEKNIKIAEKNTAPEIRMGEKKQEQRPVIIGFGPSGIFAAYVLSIHGYKPIIFELGEDIDKRIKSVDNLFSDNVLNENSNVCFGEGGAGTFSDGKLTTRINDKNCAFVIDTFHKFGADESILYQAKPHIGSDKIRDIIKNIRNEIIKNGGEIYFNSKLTDLTLEKDGMTELTINGREKIKTEGVFLGIGHSAEETYNLLIKKDFFVTQKTYSIGFRIEHKQKYIDEIVYGAFAGHKNLPPAEYMLSYTDKIIARGVYTFCMCPGGVVVNSISEKNTLLTNGMSYNDRGQANANSAILVNVYPDDYGNKASDALMFRKKIETDAYKIADKDFYAPVQTLGDFLHNKTGGIQRSLIKPSFTGNIVEYDINKLLPPKFSDPLKKGITEFEKILKGFSQPNAIITAPETRSSSAVRIERERDLLTARNNPCVYPMGEGAGYAGGIVSSAVDGINCAFKYIEKFHS